MVARKPKKQTVNRRIDIYNRRIASLTREIKTVSESYLELTEIDDDRHTAKAESYLLRRLINLSSDLSFYILEGEPDNLIEFNQVNK